MKTQKGSLDQPLINQSSELEIDEAPSRLRRFQERFLKQVQITRRRVYMDGRVEPVNYQDNLVKNTKYNVFTFVPLVLYNQFKFFFNMFFLVNAMTQLIEVLRVGLFITYIGPLIMVLSLTMAKEAYDDFNTYKRDIEVPHLPHRPTPWSTRSPARKGGAASKVKTYGWATSSRWRAPAAFQPTWWCSTRTTSRGHFSSRPTS